MDEVRRFLRFTLPGMAILGQLLLAIGITDTEAIKDFANAFGGQIDLIKAAAAAFISSGAIGFVFSSIYNTSYWILPFFGRVPLSFLRRLVSDKKLMIKDFNGNEITECGITSRRDAWTILTYYWYKNIDKTDDSKQSLGLSIITDRLTDFRHAPGTMFIGTLFGAIIWLLFLKYSHRSGCEAWTCTDCILVACWLFLLFIYGAGFYMADKALEKMGVAEISSHIDGYGKDEYPIIITVPWKQGIYNKLRSSLCTILRKRR